MAGLYLHIPFCESRCYYCDFYSSTFKGNQDLLLSSIQKELRERRQYITGPVRTIYFGGGTPSQLTTEEISSLLQTIFDNYDCRVEELTLEANPEDLAADYLQALKSLGVNRLSIGVQSFDDEDLKRINRRHTAQKAIEAVCARNPRKIICIYEDPAILARDIKRLTAAGKQVCTVLPYDPAPQTAALGSIVILN